MKITEPNARALLAAEYVLGTMKGKARARFELWLRSDPGLRKEVAAWQGRLEPLAGTLPEVQPSEHVWRQIEARIQRRAVPRENWFTSLAFWRGSSFASAAAAALLFGYIAITPKDHALTPENAMVAVMADDKANPAITVSWEMHQSTAPRLRVRVIGHQEMAPDTSWELWMLPGGDQPPRSLGLITTHDTQYVTVSSDMMAKLPAAVGLAMSVEPKHGSPTGLPTGPVLYSGKCVEI
ncbi:MAG: anti-sigma factor [Betaproteobacteria bacterium]